MTRRNTIHDRLAHTLIELVAALVASSVLLVGLGSVMLIARQIAYTPSASAHRLEAARVVYELSDELLFAAYVKESTANALEFVVADRNGDGTEERIRYEWSGTPGDPLLKTLDGGTPAAVIDSVRDFELNYSIESTDTPIATTTDSAEALLQGNTNLLSSDTRSITANTYYAQQIDPSAFSAAAPANATSWNLTRVDAYGSDDGSNSETLLIQLCTTGSPNDEPTSQAVGQLAIPESTLSDGKAWNTASFPQPVRGLALHRNYALVWAGIGSGVAFKLGSDTNAPSGVLESLDAGATWQFAETREIYYRLYGTYTSPGPTYTVTRDRLSHVDVRLQTGDAAHSTVEASIPLENKPELLAAYWYTDFDSDPTLLDANGDGDADWVTADGSPFGAGTLIGGTWEADWALETEPQAEYTGVMIADICYRCMTPSGTAVAYLNTDFQAGTNALLMAYLQLGTDGTQTLILYGRSAGGAPVPLMVRRNLPDDLVRLELVVLPEHDLVNVQVNGIELGTYSYPTRSTPQDSPILTLSALAGVAEFDYAGVRVQSPAN